MPYYFATTTQQNSASGANTDLLIVNMKTAASGQRAVIQKLMSGSYAVPADNAVRLRIHRIQTANLTSGSAITPAPQIPDAPIAYVTATTLPLIGSGVLSTVPNVQLAFNQRGTAMWAAFNPDEGCAISHGVVPFNEIVVDSQCTGVSQPINVELLHSE